LELVKHDNPFMSRVLGPMSLYAQLLAPHPKLWLIADHAGREAYGSTVEEAWTDLNDTLALARNESLAIKETSLSSCSSTPYTFKGSVALTAR
jgi:hypothetical protein